MRSVRRFRSGIASFMVALLGVLATGMPSHHHEPLPSHAEASPTIAADAHSHGMLLVDQEDRVQSAAAELAVTAEFHAVVPPPVIRRIDPALRESLPARERAPPPNAPRAPPFSS